MNLEADHESPTILLLVDDDEMSRELIRTRLRRLGYIVITAVDGKEGVQAARENRPS